MSEKIKADEYGTAVCEALGMPAENIRRVVIDAEAGNILRVYVEYFAGPELLNVRLPSGQVEIVTNLGAGDV